jgi:hypothetical protein
MLQLHLSRWALVTIAVATMLGHVCATPLYVHAGTVTTHDDHSSSAEKTDAVHAGSCDAVKALRVTSDPLVATAAAPTPLLDSTAARLVRSKPVPAATASLPLFRLHVSLLL